MTRRPLGDPGPDHRLAERPLNHRFVQMVPTTRSMLVHHRPSSTENVAPSPLAVRVRVLPHERLAEPRSADAVTPVAPVLGFGSAEMFAQRIDTGLRQRRSAILAPLAVANNDLAAIQVDVFDANTKTFQQTKSAAVHDQRTQSNRVG